MKRSLLGAVALLTLAATPAFAGGGTKIDFWYGNSGDISKVVQQVCQHFNDSQQDYTVVCTSQGAYAAAVQNTEVRRSAPSPVGGRWG
jgi:sn-glycerol 3-phosphate transport system substrate-binding protein